MTTHPGKEEDLPFPLSVVLNPTKADCYDQCPLVYYHRYVARDLPPPSSPAIKRGTEIHRVIALYNRAYMRAGAQPDPDAFLRDLWRGQVSSTPETDTLREYIDLSVLSYAHYCAFWGLRPVVVEQLITMPARPLATNSTIALTLNGRIDTILQATHSSPALSEGAYITCDLKTSIVPLTQEMRAAPSTTIQLVLSAYWMKRPVEEVTAAQLVPRLGEDVRVRFDDVELEAGRAHVRAIASGIASGVWTARENDWCPRCEILKRGLCPLQCAREADSDGAF